MKIVAPIAFILFLFCGILLAPLRTAGEVVERLVAVVNDEVIFLSELEDYGKRYFEEVRKKTPPSEVQEKLSQAKKEVLDQLIENKLLDQEIKRRKVEVSTKDIDAAVEDILKQNRITLDDLKMALAKEGMTLTTYRERLRDNIGKMRLISREIRSKIVIKEEDVRKVYRDRIEELTIPLEVQVQQIFFAVPRDASRDRVAAVEKEAGEVLKKAKNEEDFAGLAKKYSQSPEGRAGGVLGFFKSKELIPELEEAVFPLKTGEISPLVRSPEGFHILRVMERKGGEPKPFAEAQIKIREEMMQAESEKKLQEWIKALKEKSYIEIRL
ncbi:MAG: peptidyl-prolyl cis-trans isomerase [Deltaproteobacteria bacterium]|jgi:peptidyl-prolyl cis-trans isomerase SurA|nr:peptidyl-prolyl cis-trans isomerase [Deltaproteobacteria bacterium]MBP1717696.1 peptidyl-prolyl cis-trans isomerase [Deltaproteobacteria bacterium]